MKSFLLVELSVAFVFLFFVTINPDNFAFGDIEKSTQNDSIELEGYFNILEVFYSDGTYEMKNYLFVDNPITNSSTPVQLEFTNPNNSLMNFLGENVVVSGSIPNTVAQSQNSVDRAKMLVDTIDKVIPNPSTLPEIPGVAKTEVGGTPVPNEIQTLIILSKFSNNAFEPHNVAYFDDLFFNSTVGAYSLTNYYNDASYGAVNITSAGINDWTSLPSPPSVYDTFDVPFFDLMVDDAINATEFAHGPIDFDGADNIVQNNNPLNLLKTIPDGDDPDHLTIIYNNLTFNCSCALAFLGPHSVDTPSNGEMFLFISYFPDLIIGNKFSVDRSYNGGVGVPAHEYGHTFGFRHNPPPFGGVQDDPWSVMSKIADSVAENSAGPIAYHRSHAKWIPPEDIIKIGNNQTALFTLDKLSDSSPGPGFLMANITFGNNQPSDFYTLSARIDDTFDHTPESKRGLVMYHVSDLGHPGTAEPIAEASIVNVNNATDPSHWKDANLSLGQNFTVNNVTVAYLSDNATSITVEVQNNVSAPPANCSPPGIGNWVITVSCTMTASATAAGNVVLQNGAVLTIPNGITLTVPSGFGVTVLSGGGILVAVGGVMIIIS